MASCTDSRNDNEIPVPTLVSRERLAQILGLNSETVSRMAATGRIPVLRLSARCLRFDLHAVLAALNTPQKHARGDQDMERMADASNGKG